MATSAETFELSLSQTIKASPQRVYDAWLNPETRMKWWCAQEGMSCDLCDIEARVGGRYRINMLSPDRTKEYICVGEFLELDPPSRIVMTWGWEKNEDEDLHGGPVHDTTLTIDIEATDEGSNLTLSHTGFTNQTQCDSHIQGWTGCLGQLAKLLDA